MKQHSRDRIAADISRLTSDSTSMVMVHASLRRIGPVEGGADGVLDAVFQSIGKEGTVLMVLGAYDAHSWVDDQPEDLRHSLLADAEPFDAWSTRADPDVGVLAEVFRRRPGTLVSDHPEGRFAAAGELADHLVRDVPWHDYYGPDSPLARFTTRGGAVLRMGADTDTTTLLHHAEYLADVPDKRRVRRHRLIATPTGPVVRAIECLDDENGIVDRPGEDYFTTILRDYLSLGRSATGIVGSAQSHLLDAQDLVSFAADWMTANLGR